MSQMITSAQSYCRYLMEQAILCRRIDFRLRLERFALQYLEDIARESYESAKQTLTITKIFIEFGMIINEIKPEAGRRLIGKLNLLNSEVKNYNEFPNYKSEIEEKVEEKIVFDKLDNLNKEIDMNIDDEIPIYQENTIQKDLNSEIRQNALLDKIRKNPEIGLKDLKQLFPEVSDRTLRYDLQKLSQQGFVVKIGNRGPHTIYKVIDLA